MIFLSSNLGAKEMAEQTRPGLGFAGHQKVAAEKLRATAMHAVRKRFAPEFLNRIDATVTYQPLTREAMETILEHQLTAVQNLLDVRLGLQTFCLRFTAECREFLLRKGVSDEFGARELKRIVQRHVLQPVASLVVQRRIPAGRRVEVGFDPELGNTTFKLLR
jgi:ATP-dependent Clp protease ATP-binding subunit ClpA